MKYTYYWFQQKKFENKNLFWELTKKISIKDYHFIGIGTIESNAKNINDVLEEIFQQNTFNIAKMMLMYEGSFYLMGSGDVLMINNEYYWCDPVGWKNVTKEWNDNFKEVE